MQEIQQRNPRAQDRLRGGFQMPPEVPKQEGKTPKRPKFQKPSNRTLKRIGVGVVALLIAFFVYNYIDTRNELRKAADPQAAVRVEAEKLAKEVGKFLELPKDETPTVATVKNKTQLNGQVFFERSENGDKVLIYPEAKRAVLYRPSTKKVIEYAPVETTQNQ